ncbi:MAG: hypothetical protein IJM54_02270 [Thermoguttaceae bacterium]|nr:hypothetical protein [Thermoguttaceae bacterium]
METTYENTQNPTIGQAADAVLELNADEKLRQQALDCQNALNDYYSDMTHFEEKGLARGLAKGREEGLAKGREEGLAKGREEGRKEGVVEEKKAIAKKLRRENWSVERIAEFLDVPTVDVQIWLTKNNL